MLSIRTLHNVVAGILISPVIIAGLLSQAAQGIEANRSNLNSDLNDQLIANHSAARLDFSWRAAPLETASLAFNLIMNGDAGDFVGTVLLVLSGHDVYVVRARLLNSGNVPIRVYPQNIVISYPGGSTSALPIVDSRFLQPDILEPNYYIDKPVVFIAPAGFNVVQDLRVGYSDQSIEVRY